MDDNSYSSTFGPSTVGAINMFASQTNGVTATLNGTGDEVSGGSDGSLTVIGDLGPIGDVCAGPTRNQVTMGGKTIADLLNAAGRSFFGGFNLSITNSNGTTGCSRSSTGLAGTTADYVPHHAWTQYFPTTANPTHARPASMAEIGNNGPANHVYDLQDLMAVAATGGISAVSFINLSPFRTDMPATPIHWMNRPAWSPSSTP